MLLDIKDLAVTLNKSGERLIDDISLQIPCGGSAVIIGQSGSGKTMICRALFGLLNKKEFSVRGSIAFRETELLDTDRKKLRNIFGGEIAFIPQNPMTAFDPSVKLGKQLTEHYMIHSSKNSRNADLAVTTALISLGLDDPEKICSSYPHMLSGGMLQRMVIAMAVLNRPSLVIADEPTTALDAEHRIEITERLCQLREDGTAVMLITHDFVSAQRFGGPAYVMKDGVFAEQNEISRIMSSPENEYTKQLIEAALI